MADHPLLGEGEARALIGAASLMEAAQGAGDNDPGAVAEALDHNLAVWRAIGEALVRANGALLPAVRANLDKLGAAVAAASEGGNVEPAHHRLAALININRCVGARLLDGQAAQAQ